MSTRLFSRLGVDERGFTLMELMIVMVIASILMVAIGNWFVSSDRSIAEANFKIDRAGQANALFSFTDSHLTAAQLPVGLLEDGGTKINPLSIAGDQVIFTDSGTCTRLFYIKRMKQLRSVTRASCADPLIVPERGPNEALLDDDDGDGFAESGDADFDPAIDSLAPSYTTTCQGSECDNYPFLIAQRVMTGEDAVSPYGYEPKTTTLLQFALNTGFENAPVDAEADKDSSSSWYENSANRDAIGSISVAPCIALYEDGRQPWCYEPHVTTPQQAP